MSIRTEGDLSEHLPLKPLDLALLIVLSRGPEYGYQILKRVAEPEAGGLTLAPSNLYNVLDRMIRSGLVDDRGRESRDDGPPRRFFGITELGAAVLDAERSRLRALLDGADAAASA